jgi:hypothetical protein
MGNQQAMSSRVLSKVNFAIKPVFQERLPTYHAFSEVQDGMAGVAD